MSEPREIFAIIGGAGDVLFLDEGPSATAIPDSRARWEAVWAHRHLPITLVHSHPFGPDTFSEVDVETMRALDDALGRRLPFGLVTPSGTFARAADNGVIEVEPSPWEERVCRASGMPTRLERNRVRWRQAGSAHPLELLRLEAAAVREGAAMIFTDARHGVLAAHLAAALWPARPCASDGAELEPALRQRLHRVGVFPDGLASSGALAGAHRVQLSWEALQGDPVELIARDLVAMRDLLT